ncbi:hypothetical protein LEP1GSC170_3243 [Leptospira interrogans serovar Bataviae str. HAI135]|nr:hypothetical protein LEP1GSC170_3243 [Leptospira interrogans serovar Bataviae str. HAI135]
MGLMITMATYFFRKYSEILIQEYNLSLARMTGLQLSGQLKETTRKIQDFRSENSEKFFKPILTRWHTYVLKVRP